MIFPNLALENEMRFSSVVYTAGRFTGKSIQHESADNFYHSLDFLAQCCGKNTKCACTLGKCFKKKVGNDV